MGETESGERLCVMMPLFDMVNHDRASPNKIRYRGGAFELVHRGAGIAAGEEVRHRLLQPIIAKNQHLTAPSNPIFSQCKEVLLLLMPPSEILLTLQSIAVKCAV